ncbi:MAG: hypothetical protein JRE23_12545 [Deltaproteobacteria bacterium]|nr:hypothetical protein [Deltaproteobacteria bacterium]
MPNIKAVVLQTKVDENGRFLAKIRLNGKLPKVGETVSVKWGKKRSNDQNALMWAFLDYLMNDCGLKDEYIDAEELHEELKGRFLAKKVMGKGGFMTIKIGSTTDLDKLAFGEYIEKINKAMTEYKKIDVAPFWKDYKDYYGKY